MVANYGAMGVRQEIVMLLDLHQFIFRFGHVGDLLC